MILNRGLGPLRNLLSLPSPPHFEIKEQIFDKEPEIVPDPNQYKEIQPLAPRMNVTSTNKLDEIIVHTPPSTPPGSPTPSEEAELQYGGIHTTGIELKDVL